MKKKVKAVEVMSCLVFIRTPGHLDKDGTWFLQGIVYPHCQDCHINTVLLHHLCNFVFITIRLREREGKRERETDNEVLQHLSKK